VLKELLTSGSLVALLSSCTFIPPNSLNKPDYKNIRVTDIEPADDCEYVGEVSGAQGNWFSGMFTSNVYLVMGTRNSIRNQAGKYNANYVYTGDIKTIGPAFITGINYSTIIAEAYRCEGINQPESNNIIQKRCGYFSFCLYDGDSTSYREEAKPSVDNDMNNKVLKEVSKTKAKTINNSQK
jgi:hypothetical protein